LRFNSLKVKIMTIVSSKEFAINQDKYFDLAVNGDVCIKNGKNVFHLIYKTIDNKPTKQVPKNKKISKFGQMANSYAGKIQEIGNVWDL